MSTPEDSTLGKRVDTPSRYSPEVLFAIPRAAQRARIGLSAQLPFHGLDRWTAWELSWLSPSGVPQVALAQIDVPAGSPNLIESKSLKLFLNSLAGERLPSLDSLRSMIAEPLSVCAGAPVALRLMRMRDAAGLDIAELDGHCIDDASLTITHYGPPDSGLLQIERDRSEAQVWVSHLLKSNCPVTGQPDWASVRIACDGARIDPASLLRYLVSYRDHAEFHEQCVERIYCDLMRVASPRTLSVYARYTRRGGLDINPFRSSDANAQPPRARSVRQ